VKTLHNVGECRKMRYKTGPTRVVMIFEGVLEDFFGKSKIGHL